MHQKLPQWQCHKLVRAAKIANIIHKPNQDESGNSAAESHGAIIQFVDHPHDIEVTAEYVTKHNPQVGGYFVTYEDGYESYSPAKAFEDGYTRLESINRTLSNIAGQNSQ